MTHLLSLSSLGPFQASLASASLAKLSGEKLSALLIYLAMKAGHKLRREHLAELLWPDLPVESGRSNLRHAFFHLRQALGDDTNAQPFLLSGREWLSFNPDSPYRLDAQELSAAPPSCPTGPFSASCTPCLAQMENMADLYRGEFMVDLSLPDCAEFNDWLQTEREAMRRRALTLLERLSVCHEQVNGHGKALLFAQRYLELEPWNEDGLRRVMRLYALNNQISAALTQYDACSRLLKKELGVLPGIETQQLAENIRNGQLQKETRDAGVWGAGEIPPMASLPSLHAERRQATVLYCELTHSGNEDIDEAMALLHAPQAHCVDIIRQFYGHLVKTHGGGLLAYFGYPQAREDAARLAVQAALAATREAGNGIEIRAGVHTGLIITSGDLSLPDVAGKTSRLAIQLRQIARPGEVAISQTTQQLVAGYFDCAILPGRSFSGIDRSSDIFRVIRESGAHTRLEAAAQLTPLAGRKTEIAKLLKLWKSTARGGRHVVLVQGEPGIGKSRLLHALKEHLAGEPHSIRELRCFPEFSQSPFHPVVAALEVIFDFASEDSAEIKIAKLSRYLQTRHPDKAAESLPFLAQLLNLSAAQPASTLSPQKYKEQTLSILLDLLHNLSSLQPVLLIIEDLHWIDPSTLELLNLFVAPYKSASILTVLTARPEFAVSWNEHLDQTLVLAPLDEGEVAKMVKSLDTGIPPAAISQIVERADGVPLFVEEMARMVMSDHQASIPATLHDLLAARMDQIGEAKYTAQLAASLGREFDLDLLRKISPCDRETLAHTLGVLQDAGLILQVNETTRQFKHALIQEAAYQSQTKAGRQAAHQRIAQTLLSDFPDAAKTRPELLAQHLGAAGETPQAIAYWIKAGQRAARSSANLEAIEHFNSGLQLLMTLPANLDRDRMEFNILMSLCPVLYAAKGYGSEDATQASARISILNGLVGDSPDLFQAKWALVINTIASAGSRGMPEAAMQLLSMAQDDPMRKLAAHFLAANSSFWLGEFESTLAHDEQVIALYRPHQHQMLLEQYGTDLSVFSAGYALSALYFLGFPHRAQRVYQRMLEQARALAHPHTLAQALSFAAILHRWLNRPAEALSFAAEAIVIARQHDFSLWLACGEMTHGWALVMHGRNEDGIAEIQSSIAGMRAALGGISVIFLSPLIEVYVHLERYDEALVLIAEAQADAENTGDGHFSAELHRLKGVCLLALSPSNAAQAESCFDQALSISRKQHAKLLELRTAVSLAQLWRHQGRQADALSMLEEIYNRFTEGFDTTDLQKAAILIRRD